MAETISGAIEKINETIQSSNNTLSKSISISIDSSSEAVVNNLNSSTTLLAKSIDSSSEVVVSSIDNSTTLLAKSIELSSSLLQSSVDNLSAAMISTSDGVTFKTALFTFMIALVGAMSAFFFNWIQWKLSKRKELISNISFTLIHAIEDYKDVAVNYWMQDYNSKRSFDSSISEIKIKSSFLQINAFSNSLKCHIEKSKIRKDKYKNEREIIMKYVDDIYEITQGGDFESVNRKSDKELSTRINSKCTKLITTVSKIAYSK